MSHNFAGVADRLDEIGNDTRFSAEFVGNMVRANLPAILAALRASDTGRSEAEVSEEAELPAGEPITEEASDAALEIAQAIEAAIQVRGVFSYAPDGRPCLTWYGEQRIAKVIDAHLEDEPDTGRSDAEAGSIVATGWLASMGRQEGEDRGPVVQFVMDASRDHAMKFANIWDGGTYEIRALSHPAPEAPHPPARGRGHGDG